MIEFTVYGNPVPWKSHSHSKWGGGYSDPKQREYKEIVGFEAVKANRVKGRNGYYLKFKVGLKPENFPLKLTLKVYRSIPKSWSKKKKEQALSGKIRPTTRPDNTNYQKIIEDGMTSILYRDDSQIVCNVTEKYYSDNPRVEVKIEVI